MEYINMTIKRQKNIALIAHDGKKQDMIQWCYDNKEILKIIVCPVPELLQE